MINSGRKVIAKIESLTGLSLKRAIKFCLVGASGVAVNMGVFYFFNENTAIAYQLSSIIAIEVSIINNFFWNNLWTWKDRATDDLREKKVRFFKYHLVTGFSALINYGILILLVELLGFDKYLSNLVGILVAMGINFIVNHKWTFKKNEEI